MNTASATILGFALALSALAEQPKVSPDSVLVVLKDRLEHEFQKLDPKPTFEFPDGYEGRSLVVQFKTREYVVHPSIKGHIAETTVKREGPSNQGFLLRVHVQPLGEVNQAVVPQVIREPYWDLYLNVYPVKHTQKQIYFCLSYRGGTDRTLIETMKKIAEQIDAKTPATEAARASAQPAASFRLLSTQGKPILTDVDIVGYSWPTHTLILRPGVVTKLKSALMGKLVQGVAFKMEANGVVCYQGVFTTSLSSISQSCTVIDFDPIGKAPDEQKDQLSITLGYPSEKFFRGRDPRGDLRIRAALAALDKLKTSIQATLEVIPGRPGWFVMHITNASARTIRLLDIREGAAWCGEFYEITVEKDGKTYESKGNCLYAPGDVPRIVELVPGQNYDRDIQPGAYVGEKYLIPPCKISVTYRLTEKIKEKWKGNADNADLDLTFQTTKVEKDTSNKKLKSVGDPEP